MIARPKDTLGNGCFDFCNPYGEPLDNCVRCLGLLGGARGNENRIDGRVLCDYCTVAVERGRSDEIWCDCGRPISGHKVVLSTEEFMETWQEGHVASICGRGNPLDPPGNVSVPVLLWLNNRPESPCDEDFMREIST